MKMEGYQLLECLVVCLLLSAMLGVGGSAFLQFLDRYRLEIAAKGLVAHLVEVRTAAVSRKMPISVSVSSCRSKYGIGPRDLEVAVWRSLPTGVNFVDPIRQSLTFYSRGNAVPAGTLSLSNNAGYCKVVVSPTGRIRCENLVQNESE